MVSGSISPALQSQWQNAVKDKRLSEAEINSLAQGLKAASPELSDADVQAQLQALAANEAPDIQESLALHDFSSHDSAPVDVRFQSKRVDFEVEGATLSDKNGVTEAAADDLSGKVDRARANMPLPAGQDKALLEGLKQDMVTKMLAGLPEGDNATDMQQVQRALLKHIEITPRQENGQTLYDFSLNPAFRDELSLPQAAFLATAEFFGQVDISGPLATFSTPNGEVKVDFNGTLAEMMTAPEKIVPDFGAAPASPAAASPAAALDPAAVASQVQDALSVLDGKGYSAAHHGDPVGGIPKVARAMDQLLSLYNQGALESLPPELKDKAAQWALDTAAARTGKAVQRWTGMNPSENKALLQQLQSPAFQALPEAQQQRVIQQAQSTAEMLHGRGTEKLSDDQRAVLATLKPGLQPWQETDRSSFEALVQDQVAGLKSEGIDLKVDVVPDSTGKSYTLKPRAVTLSGEALAKLSAAPPAWASGMDLSQGTLTLTPEQFKVNFGPEGLSVAFENLDIQGGTDTSAAPVDAQDRASTLAVDAASGSAQLNARGELEALSLAELTGRLSGEATVSDAVVEVVQEKVKTALSELDQSLAQYGLSREQLSQLMGQLPADALKDLMSSANQGDIARVAGQLGIDGKSLSNTIQFLREQPVQQIVNDLGALSDRLAVGTRLEGGVEFKLSDLHLSANDQQWMAQLGALDLSTAAGTQAVTPDGQRTALDASLHSESLAVSHDATQNAGERTTASLGRTELNAAATSAAPVPPETPPPAPQAQISAFTESLAKGGENYRVPDGDPAGRSGYLVDDTLRSKKGLKVEDALAQLKKAPPEAWAEVLGADATARNTFYKQYGIDQSYDDYMIRYLNEYVVNQAPSQDTTQTAAARVGFDSAQTGPEGSEVNGVTAEATVTADDGKHRTELHVEASAEQAATEAGVLTLDALAANGTATVTENQGDITRAEAELAIGQVQATAGEGVVADDVGGKAHIQSESEQHAPVDARVEGLFEQIRANDEGLQTEGARADFEGKSGPTEVSVNTGDHLAVSSDAEGLDVKGDLNWELRTAGSGGRVAGSGKLAVEIEDNQLQGTRTEAGAANGTVRTDRDTLLAFVENNSPGVADFFKKHGVLGQKNVTIQVKNTEAVVTGKNGSLDQYQVRASVSNVNTPYGKASASMYVDDDGSITGDVLIRNPTDKLPDLLKTQIQEALLKADVPPEKVALLDVRLEQGKFVVSLEAMKLAEIGLDIALDGDQVHVNINQADLKNKLFNSLKDAFGLDGFFKRTARNTLQTELQGKNLGLQSTQNGNYGLTIQTQDIVAKFLGDDAQGVRIRPRFDASGNLNLRYNIN